MVQFYAVIAAVVFVLVGLLGYQTWAKGQLEQALGSAESDKRYLVQLNEEQASLASAAWREIDRQAKTVAPR